jgi:hypothetical protein
MTSDEMKCGIAALFWIGATCAGIADGLAFNRLAVSIFAFQGLYFICLGFALALVESWRSYQ